MQTMKKSYRIILAIILLAEMAMTIRIVTDPYRKAQHRYEDIVAVGIDSQTALRTALYEVGITNWSDNAQEEDYDNIHNYQP
jgi:hypothetical protein